MFGCNIREQKKFFEGEDAHFVFSVGNFVSKNSSPSLGLSLPYVKPLSYGFSQVLPCIGPYFGNTLVLGLYPTHKHNIRQFKFY